MVILPETASEGAVKFAERIRARVMRASRSTSARSDAGAFDGEHRRRDFSVARRSQATEELLRWRTRRCIARRPAAGTECAPESYVNFGMSAAARLATPSTPTTRDSARATGRSSSRSRRRRDPEFAAAPSSHARVFQPVGARVARPRSGRVRRVSARSTARLLPARRRDARWPLRDRARRSARAECRSSISPTTSRRRSGTRSRFCRRRCRTTRTRWRASAARRASAVRLAHPNVCHIIRLGETRDGFVYVVMPFVEGEMLCRHDQPCDGQLPLAVTVRFITRHRGGPARRARAQDRPSRSQAREHHDQQRSDGGDTAVVMDFGLAKERQAGAELQEAHGHRNHARHARVHEPGAAARQAARSRAPTCIRSASWRTRCSRGKLPFVGAHAAGDDDRAAAERAHADPRGQAGSRLSGGRRTRAAEEHAARACGPVPDGAGVRGRTLACGGTHARRRDARQNIWTLTASFCTVAAGPLQRLAANGQISFHEAIRCVRATRIRRLGPR